MIREMVHYAADCYNSQPDSRVYVSKDVVDEVTNYLLKHLKVMLEEQYPSDLVEAALVDDNPYLIQERILALRRFREQQPFLFSSLLKAYKRCYNINIAKNVQSKNVQCQTEPDFSLFDLPEERQLVEAYLLLKEAEKLYKYDYYEALLFVSIVITRPINAFLDNVYVREKEHRLFLLSSIVKVVNKIAFLERIKN